MVRFLFSVVFTAVILSLAVWFFLPELKESNFSAYSGIAKALGVEVSASAAENSEVESPETSSVSDDEDAVSDGSGEDPSLPKFVLKKDRKSGSSKETQIGTESQDSESGSSGAPSSSAMQVVSDPGLPWGIVVTNSAFYVYEGYGLRRAGTVKGGTVFEYANEKTLNEGKCYSCKFLKNNEWTEKFFVVRDCDVVIFPDVTFSEADPEQRKMLIDFCTLYGKYEGLRYAEYERQASQYVNPYEKDYLNEKEKYDEFQAEVKKMMALEKRTQRENIPGVSRGKVLADLRKMGVKEKEIEKIFFPIRDKYEAWEAGHERKEIIVEDSPEMIGLLERMREMKSRVNSIVPGLMPADL